MDTLTGLGFLLHLSDARRLRILGREKGLQSDVNCVCCLFSSILVSAAPLPLQGATLLQQLGRGRRGSTEPKH